MGWRESFFIFFYSPRANPFPIAISSSLIGSHSRSNTSSRPPSSKPQTPPVVRPEITEHLSGNNYFLHSHSTSLPHRFYALASSFSFPLRCVNHISLSHSGACFVH